MGSMILIRGVSGSGKTRFTELLSNWDNTIFLEADDYFYVGHGDDCKYIFDANKLGEAHAWCQETARKAVEDGLDVVVSNTFTTEKELKPYIDLAKEYGYILTVIVMEKRHENTDVHDVPDHIKRRQALRLQQSIKLI